MDRRAFLVATGAATLGWRAALAAAAREPRALVTCDAEARLALVDLTSLRVVRRIDCLPDPRSVERVGAQALVCHTAVGALSVIAPDGRVRHVLHGFVEPRYTAAHPDGVHAFVTDSGRSSVVTVDVERGVVLGRVRLREWARHLTLDPTGRTLWVGLGSASPDVAIVDVSQPGRPRHAATVTPPFRAHDVGFLPDGRHTWVTSGDARETAIFRGDRALLRLPADLAPQHVTFGAGRAFVTSGDSGTLHVQDLGGRVLSRHAVPAGSYNVQYAHGRVITPSLSQGTLAVFDGRGRPVRTVKVAGSCHDACVLA
jgi:DNA-binding beta-propeller fold protein YncE